MSKSEKSPQRFKEGIRRLNERFNTLSHVVMAGLSENGGGRAVSVPHEGIDYVAVSRSIDEQTTLNLYANGSWTIGTVDSQPHVIVKAKPGQDIKADAILPAYAKLHFADRIVSKIPKSKTEKFRRLMQRALSPEEQQALGAEFIKPYVDEFVLTHELDLMEGLVADLTRAYGPMLRVTPPIEAL